MRARVRVRLRVGIRLRVRVRVRLRPTVEAMRAAMASRFASSWPGVLSHDGVFLFLKEEVSSRSWP